MADTFLDMVADFPVPVLFGKHSEPWWKKKRKNMAYWSTPSDTFECVNLHPFITQSGQFS